MKRLLLILLLVTSMMIGVAIPAYAIDPPDNKSLQSVEVFRNLAEDGDMLMVFHWNWEFSVNGTDQFPSVPASDSIMYRFYDTDGTTLLATGRPYVFSTIETNGYGNNVGSFYFNAAANRTWGEAYVLNIYGTPGFFSPAETFSYTLTTSDYTTQTTQAANRAELYNHIMLLCDRFNSLFDVELKTSSDSGVVLSSYGELFFSGAIGGLQTLCPQLFFIQVYIPEIMEVDPYDLSLQTTYTERLTGTDLENGFERLGAFMGGMSGSLAAGLWFFVVIMAVCIFTLRKGWPIELGMGASVIIGIFAAILLGDVMFTLVMIGSLVAGLGIFYLLTFKRS
jgi:hypothetical protein